LLGIATVSRIPELGFLSLALVAAAWRDSLGLSDSVIRLSVYIELAIEHTNPGMQWERVSAEAIEHAYHHKSTVRKLRASAVSSYGVFALLASTVTAILLIWQLVGDDVDVQLSVQAPRS
jgi:hypothetical protein